jgi:fucose permease
LRYINRSNEAVERGGIRSLNFICYAAIGFLGVYISVFQSAVASIMAEYGLDAGAMGILISLHFAGSLLMPVVLGEFGDRAGTKALIICGFIILIAGLSFLLADGPVVLFAAGVFLIGGGFSAAEGAVTSLLVEANPGRENGSVNLSQMCFCIGAACGPLLGRAVMTIGAGWRAVFGLLTVAFTVCLVMIACMRLPSAKPAESGGLRIGRLIKYRAFLLLLFSIFLYVGIEEGVAFWVSSYMTSAHPLMVTGIGFITAFWMGMALGRFLYSRLLAPSLRISLAWAAVSLLFLVGLLVLSNIGLLLMCVFAVGMGLAPVWTDLMVTASLRYRQSGNTAIGAMMAIGAAGGLVVPAALGHTAVMIGMERAFWAFPILLLVLLIMVFLLIGKGSR